MSFNNFSPSLDGIRRRSMSLDRHWANIKRKYTTDEIDAARDEILTMFNTASSRKFEVSKAESRVGTSVFQDMLYMFKLLGKTPLGRQNDYVASASQYFKKTAKKPSSWKPISHDSKKPGLAF